MGTDNTETKIIEIMTLIGVNKSDFARASDNFRSMPDTELDTKLARLRAGERRIEAWRAERGPATPAA